MVQQQSFWYKIILEVEHSNTNQLNLQSRVHKMDSIDVTIQTTPNKAIDAIVQKIFTEITKRESAELPYTFIKRVTSAKSFTEDMHPALEEETRDGGLDNRIYTALSTRTP